MTVLGKCRKVVLAIKVLELLSNKIDGCRCGTQQKIINCNKSEKKITTPEILVVNVNFFLLCFSAGGVALTLLVVLICYQVSQMKKQKKKESQPTKEERDKAGTIANHVNEHDARERMREFFLQGNRSQQWDKESMMLDEKIDHHSDAFKTRADENGSNVLCLHCISKGKMSNQMRKGKWVNRGTDTEDEQERRKLRMMEEESEIVAIQQQHFSWDISNKFPSHNTNSSFNLLRETSDNLPPYKTDSDRDNYRTDDGSKARSYETLHCRNCHRAYRTSEQSMAHRTTHANHKDSFAFNSKVRREPSRIINQDLKRESRNVKFDLDSLRTNQGRESLEEVATPRGNEKSSKGRHKEQSSRLLKVKLNLNPLRKSKVHPKKKTEHGHTKSTSSKRSKEKRRHGNSKEEEAEEKSEKKSGSSREKKRTSKTREGTDKGEQKSSRSKSEKKSETDQEKKQHPDSSQPPDSTTISAQNLEPLLYQTTGLTSAGTQLFYQHPFSFSSADRNRSTSLSLLGSAGSQLTGSTLSLQAGNALLNTLPLGSNPLLTSGLTNPIAAGVRFSGFNTAPSGATESSTGQPAEGIRSSNPALLSNMVQASPLQAGGKHSAPLLSSKLEDSALSLANPANNPAALGHSQMQVDSSASVATLKLDLTQGQEIQNGRGHLQASTESQSPSTKADLTEQGQDKLPGDTAIENMSNINMPSEGVAQVEGPRLGAPGENMKAAGMSVLDISVPSLPIQSESSPAAGGAALLQQEYLFEEEEGSSPRRKLRLVLPEKASKRPPTALERKIR